MESKREEQLFRQEAEREARETAGINDEKLMRAIRSGVKRGGAQSRRRTYRYVGAGAAGAALAAGLFLAADGPELWNRAAVVQAPAPEQTADEGGSWGEYEQFRASASADPVLKAALDKGEVQPLDVTAEGDGYTLELFGTVRDSRKLTLLYAIGGEGVRSTAVSLGRLTDASGRELGKQEERRDFYVDGRLYGYATFALNGAEGEELKAFKLEAPIYSRTANPGYDKDSEKLAVLTADVALKPAANGGAVGSLEQELAAGQTMTVDGQLLRVQEALITPQRGYLVLVSDAANDKNISRLVGAKLTVTKDGKATVSKGGPGVGVVLTEEDGSTRFEFTFNRVPLPKDPDSVTFSVEGIEALSREEQKLVVDTEKKKVLQAPDPGTSVDVNPGAEGTEVLQLNYPIDSERFFGEDPPSLMYLDTTFADADGKEYPLSSFVGENGMVVSEVQPGSKSTFASYVMEDKDYAQPLTFKILVYPKEILEHRELKLK
ncbi:hypothetical protein [Saccharibacillus alkalitolerans]|uniref:DUF4179 domain-containing protein n=1 Tax=Saccharibacillus alkalitolerans TaxID=2705290 RepID=A0ABX0F8S0_9BACL|nr:hypothetical protein [Saccharibacillus alkalitolerans]NGZ77361.1 hypothetical protein [Saccharibacillus alkalitolerans]